MAIYRNGRLRDETDRQDRTVPTGGAGQVAQVSGAGTVKQEPLAAGANSQKPVGYQQSDAFRQAQQMLKQQMAQKPGQYQSAWQDQLDEIMGKILGREEFKYDLNGDALYQQYKDQYTRNGQMAMMDTMGQAAALTGGYGNSYAQTVGQQTYNGYLQQLNDRIPELYQLALDKYRMEGDALMDQYALIGARDDQDYGRYRDGLSDYYQQMGLITDVYRDERNFGYGVDRDQEADRQWQAEFDEAKRRYDQQWAEAHPEEDSEDTGADTGPGPGPGPGPGEGYDNGGYDAEIVKLAQAYVGATADGMWGPASVAAAKRAGFQSLSDVVKRATRGQSGNGNTENGSSGGFTGTTYSEAVAYMKENGVSSEHAANILTESEWRRAKASDSPRYGANEYNTYAEYLSDAVAYNIEVHSE